MAVKQKIRQIQMVNVADIRDAGFNPKDRTERKNLATLRDAILQAGEIINPIILSRDMHVIDGHRRVAVARELHWSTVPAIVVEYGLQEGWSILNGATRPITPREWLSAAALGMDTRYMPKKHASRIEKIRTLVDDDGLLMLMERKKSTYLIVLTEAICRAMGDDTHEYARDTLVWMAKHGMQYGAQRAIREGNIIDLADAIANDAPLEYK